jgi:hypothetical protein
MKILLADALVVLHLAVVLYVLIGQAAILVGWVLRWSWIRNFWFRIIHLAIMLTVAVEGALGITCPLTTWEYELRLAAGQAPSAVSFVGRMARDILFVEAPQELLNKIYIAFFGLVFLTLVACRPRRPGQRKSILPPAPRQEFHDDGPPDSDEL